LRILFLAHLFPLPPDSGGKIKSYYTLRALANEHEVSTLSYVRTDEERRLLPELKEVSPALATIPLIRGVGRQATDVFSSLATRRSFIISRDYRSTMQDKFRQIVDDFRPDVVHIDHLQMAQFVDFSGTYKTVLDHHNVESTIIKRVAETGTSTAARLYAGIEWPKLRRYEISICKQCDLVLTVSEQDKWALADMGADSARLEAVPIGVDVHYFQPRERNTASNSILSVGTMYWPPNVDSMLYFCKEVLPIIRESMPSADLTIAGQRPTAAIRALASEPGISVTGYVDDMRELAPHCGAFIVPLRSGSGVRVKILNALAMGLPVVSTSIGAEGLEVRSGEHLLIADTSEEFAKAVIRLLSDADLGAELGRRGRELVCAKYSWEIVSQQLLELYRNRLG
jgi:glycosyltransferase involved in cell wall biosynthesis